MPHPLAKVLQHLRRTARPAGASATDSEFLERFATAADETAFEALLERHGPMVWNVCRRVLANASDADDAFQAVFLVLLRKARSIRRQDSVASWLHGVAYRIALDARARAARRRLHEQQATAPVMDQRDPRAGWDDVRQVLDEELSRLPEKYRMPLVLCYLEGKTNDEAADQLGWTRGTVAGRLSRARDLLRGRLTRRGLAVAPTVLFPLIVDNAASAKVPATLNPLPWQPVLGYAAVRPYVPAAAVGLAEGALHAMFMTRVKFAAALVAALALIAVTAGWFWQQAEAQPPAETPKAAPATVQAIVVNIDPKQARADRPELVKDNNAFAFDLYGQLREADGNVLYSPYSISTALSMVYAGARGTTAEQMARVLHYTLPQERLHSAAGSLVRDLNGADRAKAPPYQLHVANALWGQKGFAFLDGFIKLTRDSYGAGLAEVDFKNDRPKARKTINDWVANQTQDKIPQLLAEEHLLPTTRLVLTNAIYFKAEWEDKFLRQSTKKLPFTLADGKKVDVATMQRLGQYAYFDGGTFQMVDLPYAGKDLSLLVLLPKKAGGLAELEQNLSVDKIAQWHGKLAAAEVLVALPKFKFASQFELKKNLIALGMQLPFQASAADFSGMNGSPGLYISAVVHKTMIDVNEEGTEAAGATAAVMSFGGKPPQQTVTFRADHPFVFLVRDNHSGSILFVGRVADPTR